MTLNILTPEWNRTLDAEAVFLPGVKGGFEILPGHAPIVSALENGVLRWRSSGVEESLPVKGGVVKVAMNVINVCVEV